MANCGESGEEEEEPEEGDAEAGRPSKKARGEPQQQQQRRAVCSGCGRPESVCLCAAFPSAPLPLPVTLKSVLLLRHPKERRQKHQSAWILERCVTGVRQHPARKLPPEPPSGLEFIYERPASCVLVFPSAGAKPLHEVLDAGVQHLIFIDATWRFAKEMVAASEPLAAVRCAVLTPPPSTRPVFVVRKPLRLPPSGNAAPEAGEDGADDERWGFSTAEAVGLALDEAQRVLSDAVPPHSYYPAVASALGAYARKQLERTTAPRARPERPGFIPGLYEGTRAGDCSAACEVAASTDSGEAATSAVTGDPGATCA